MRKPGDPRKRKKIEPRVIVKKEESGWFKLGDAFLERGGYEPLCALNGKPVYVAGKIGELVIVSVPKDSSPQSMLALRKALTKEGAAVLIVTDDVKFLRAERVNDPALEKRLNAQASYQAEALRKTAGADDTDAPADGPGPVTDGAGTGGEAVLDDPRSEAPAD